MSPPQPSNDLGRLALVDSPIEVGPYGRNGHKFDVYLPSGLANQALPALVYFHGGGLIMGSKSSVPSWNKEPALLAGLAVISPDYSKLPGCTAFHLIEDVQDLHKAIGELELPNGLRIDLGRLILAGSSAGCYVLRLLCRVADPPIKAIGLQWALGGDLTADYWVKGHDLATIPYYTQYPARNLLSDWLQDGTYLDHLTGRPGIGSLLSQLPPTERLAAIPHDLLPCFVQRDTKDLPPIAIVHGALDSLVPVDQSFVVAAELAQRNKEYRLEIVEGMEHSFKEATRAQTPPGDKAGAMGRMMAFLLSKV